MSKKVLDLTILVNNMALYNRDALYKQLFVSPSRFSYYLLKPKEIAEEVASDGIWLVKKALAQKIIM